MNIPKALAELDKGSSELVAAFLYAQGITGVPGMACRCPVARFLTAKLGKDVAVAHDEAMTYEAIDTGNGVPLPDAVSDFVTRFDRGEYPGLISPEPPVSVVG